jgi:lysophospholipase L1-like esterase
MAMTRLSGMALAALFLVSSSAFAGNPAALSDNIRYLSIGDSFAAGKGAIPNTQGFAYLLYQGGTFGSITNVTFNQAAMGGTTSADVLAHQVPQVKRFKPHVITLFVGGNDFQRILRGEDATVVLQEFLSNMTGILCTLKKEMLSQGIEGKIIVGNQPDFPWLSANKPEVRQLIMLANSLLADVAQACGARIADVFSAFEGREAYYLYYRQGADPNEGHPTNAGYRAIASAFEDAANR